MAKDAKEQIAEEPIAQEQTTPVPPTQEQLMSDMQTALTAGDFKAVAKISRQIDSMQRAAEKAELDAKRAALEGMSQLVKGAINEAVAGLIADGQLDAADGIWYAYDFGEAEATVRLTKTATRTRTGGGGTGKKFDISTEDMLSRHGDEAYKDGMTFRQAYESNTDKNWRYAIRQKLLKLEGII